MSDLTQKQLNDMQDDLMDAYRVTVTKHTNGSMRPGEVLAVLGGLVATVVVNNVKVIVPMALKEDGMVLCESCTYFKLMMSFVEMVDNVSLGTLTSLQHEEPHEDEDRYRGRH